MIKTKKEIIENLKAKCENGDVYAMEELATFYTQDHPELIEGDMINLLITYYQRAIESGISRAALNLGALYYNGVFVKQDYKKAMELYQIASEGDDSNIVSIALCNLGYCHYYGRDTKIDYAKAFDYFFKGAVLYDNPICLYKLGDMYRLGLNVLPNENTAYLLYKKAELLSDLSDDSYPDIVQRLAKILLNSTDDRKALRALQYLTKAQCELYKKLYYYHDSRVEEKIRTLEELTNRAKLICQMREG